MAGFVTVPGAGGTTITISYNANLVPIANQVLQNVIAAFNNGTINVQNKPGASIAGGTNEAVYINNDPAIPPGYDTSVIGVAAASNGVITSGPVGVYDANPDANQAILFGGVPATFVAGQGSGTIVGSQGADTIIGSTTGSNWRIFTDSGAKGSLIFTGADSDAITSLGNSDTIVGGSGSDTIASFGTNAVVFGGTATTEQTLYINGTTSGTDTFVGGAGSDTVFAGSNHGIYIGTTGTLLFVNDTSSPTLFGGTGSETLFAGSGNGTYVEGAGAWTFVDNGGGSDNIFGGAKSAFFGSAGGQINLIGNSVGGNIFAAGSGNETLSSAFSQGAGNIFIAGNGNDVIYGGTGNDTFFTNTTGSATIFGGQGANQGDVFVLSAGAARDFTIWDFNAKSTLSLNGFGANAIKSETQVQFGTQLTLSDNTKITLLNVTHINPGQITNN